MSLATRSKDSESDGEPSSASLAAIEKVIKADLVSRVVEDAEVPRVTAAAAVDAILDGMKNALSEGKRIELRGFGVFQVRARKKGMGRNPRTGVEVPISPGKTVRFKPGKDLRELV